MSNKFSEQSGNSLTDLHTGLCTTRAKQAKTKERQINITGPKELSCIEPLLAAVIEDLGFGTETRLSLESRITDNKFNEPFQPTY